jgi:hypothetical protein
MAQRARKLRSNATVAPTTPARSARTRECKDCKGIHFAEQMAAMENLPFLAVYLTGSERVVTLDDVEEYVRWRNRPGGIGRRAWLRRTTAPAGA